MRPLHLIGFAAFGAMTSVGCSSLRAEQPSKPIQQCEEEFRARETSLQSAGVSAASFFHQCWWHSKAGHATDISFASAKPPSTKDLKVRVADRPRTRKRAVAQTSTNATQHSASAIDRRERRREARLQRRLAHNIAMRARHLVLMAQTKHQSTRHSAYADARRRNETHDRDVRLASYHRRDARRRERYARLRDQRGETNDQPLGDRSVVIPANAVEGRRSWIGTVTASGRTTVAAVIIGPLRTTATGGTALHCWDQKVLFLSADASWRPSLVCDAKVVSARKTTWFEQYAQRL